MSRDKSGRNSRIAIVTGASSGIGEATARKFVAEGYAVVGNARNADKLKALEQELGPAFFGVAGDAADETVLDSLFSSAIAFNVSTIIDMLILIIFSVNSKYFLVKDSHLKMLLD